jgi:hypothetical protein
MKMYTLIEAHGNLFVEKKGESTLCPSKIVVTKLEILHLVFLGTYRHQIMDYFCSFQVYCISFKLKLVNLKRNFNKHLQT